MGVVTCEIMLCEGPGRSNFTATRANIDGVETIEVKVCIVHFLFIDRLRAAANNAYDEQEAQEYMWKTLVMATHKPALRASIDAAGLNSDLPELED